MTPTVTTNLSKPQVESFTLTVSLDDFRLLHLLLANITDHFCTQALGIKHSGDKLYTALDTALDAHRLAPAMSTPLVWETYAPVAAKAVKQMVAKVSHSGAQDVSEFLERMIPTHAPLPNAQAWQEVADALFAITNDTDAIVLTP